MSRNKMLVLFALLVLVASAGCTGEEAVTETASQSQTVSDSEPAATPEEVLEELGLTDVATMQSNGLIVHKVDNYVMSAQGVSAKVRAKRATCFTALSQDQSSGACTQSLKDEFSRMPAPCTLSPKAEAPKSGICSYVSK